MANLGRYFAQILNIMPVINTCEALEMQGYPVAYISSNNDGIVSESALKKSFILHLLYQL